MKTEAADVVRPNLQSKALFDHNLEEKKALEYLRNLINSPVLNSRPFEMFNYASDVLGFDKTVPLLIKLYPDVMKDNPFLDESMIRHNLKCLIPHKIIIVLMKNSISALIDKSLKKLSSRKQCEVERRFQIVKDTFRLTEHELELLTLYFLNDSGIIREHFNGRNFLDLSEFSKIRNYAHFLFGVKRSNISRVLADGKLIETHLLEKTLHLGITDWCLHYLLGFGERELSHEFFSRKNGVILRLSDFDINRDEFDVLDTLIKSNSGHNILFYGEPGTGKTTLAKCLAKTYGKDLITVRVPEKDDHKNRISAIYATINATEPETSLILIDEADEMLNTDDSFFFRSKTNKSWINTIMENHKQKIIWITNKCEAIHRSTMRRFSFSMEFKNLDEKKRQKILTRELEKEGLSAYFNEKEIRELCKTYSVNAGGIIDAIHVLNINRNADKDTALKKINTVLKNHEKVTAGKKSLISENRKDFSGYSLKGLNCTEDPEKIIGIIKRYTEQQENGMLQSKRPMSLLLHGIPGTGKSEFVYYLGHILDKEVVLRRCSDIHSMWVGETEKNIANAFEEAQKDEKILFFDEADSFLFPRRDASHSWEKNFTNEILTQLESFTGVVIFATNEIDGLDHASLRRFRFKVEFKPLTSEGNLHFYNNLLGSLGFDNNELTHDEIAKIKSTRNLTPGDFAVVKDQYIFIEPSIISHQKLIESLINEVRHKQNITPIGFGK